MFQSMKEAWNKIQDDPPGKRFRRQYRRRQAAREGFLKRALFVGAGIVFGNLGIIMIFTPGPGLFFIFIGLGLVAQESLFLALFLDKIEVNLRKWAEWIQQTWDRISIFFKCVIIVIAILITALVIYGAYVTFLT